MLNRFVIVIILLIFNFVFSQNKSFVYELKFKPDPLKDSLSKESYILDVSGFKSMFRATEEKKADSLSSHTATWI